MPLKEDTELMPSTLETIDTAFYNWVNETLDISATSNRGWNKVPLIWVSAERSFQVKNDKDLRDEFGVLKLLGIRWSSICVKAFAACRHILGHRLQQSRRCP